MIETHDLEILAGELSGRGSDMMPQVNPLCEALAEVYFTDRYPGFDLEEPDWPTFRQQLNAVSGLAEVVKARLG